MLKRKSLCTFHAHSKYRSRSSFLFKQGFLPGVGAHQGCARLMSRESNLTRLWLKWVESESSRPWKSRIWVDQSRVTLMVIWVRVESTGYAWVKDFSRRKRQDLAVICNFAVKEPNLQLHSTAPPPPRSTTFPKLGKMWWVVSQI